MIERYGSSAISVPSRARSAKLVTASVGVALLALPWIVDGYTLHLAILAAIAVILASSLNLITGYVGKLSLGHAAFYGIGAYTSALLSVSLGWPVLIGIAASAVVSALCALLIGPIVLRLRGAHFIIVTLSVSMVIQLILVNWIDLTNGPMGILGIPYPQLGPIDFSRKEVYFYFVAALSSSDRLVDRPHRSFANRACI